MRFHVKDGNGKTAAMFRTQAPAINHAMGKAGYYVFDTVTNEKTWPYREKVAGKLLTIIMLLSLGSVMSVDLWPNDPNREFTTAEGIPLPRRKPSVASTNECLAVTMEALKGSVTFSALEAPEL